MNRPIHLQIQQSTPAQANPNDDLADNESVASSSITSNASDDSFYDTTDDENFDESFKQTITGPSTPRHSERTAGRPQPTYVPPKYSFNVVDHSTNTPISPEEALSSPDAHLWRKTMEEEMNAHKVNKTWILTDLPVDKKAIPNKWVFKIKRDNNGNAIKYKARLVVKGCSQRQGIDYEETFAPVIRYNTLRFLIALAAKHNLEIRQLDAVTAFLNGELKEDIYMKQPNEFSDGTKQVCKLQKSLYGLKQASRIWNEALNSVLVKFGLKRNDADQCVYHRIEGESIIIVAVYVDDVVIFSNHKKWENELCSTLSSNFQMKNLGEAKQVLGTRIIRDRKSGTISIDQTQYLLDVLDRFRMSDCNPVSTPLDLNQKISLKFCPKSDEERQEMAEIPYEQLIGCLQFAAQVTRPDICFAVNLLSRYKANPGKAHWGAAKRILRYIKGTINKRLVYTNTPTQIQAYCDADYASDLDERKSTTGYVFMFQGSAISWKSKRQKTIALSSTESEYMSVPYQEM